MLCTQPHERVRCVKWATNGLIVTFAVDTPWVSRGHMERVCVRVCSPVRVRVVYVTSGDMNVVIVWFSCLSFSLLSSPATVKVRPNISSPRNFEHTVHVGFNPDTGEFTVGVHL